MTQSSVVGVGSTRTRADVQKRCAYIQMLARYNWEAPRPRQPEPEPEPPKPESPKRKKHVQIEIHDPPESPCPLPAPQPKVLEPPAKAKSVKWIVIASAGCLFVTGAVAGYGLCYIM